MIAVGLLMGQLGINFLLFFSSFRIGVAIGIFISDKSVINSRERGIEMSYLLREYSLDFCE